MKVQVGGTEQYAKNERPVTVDSCCGCTSHDKNREVTRIENILNNNEFS